MTMSRPGLLPALLAKRAKLAMLAVLAVLAMLLLASLFLVLARRRAARVGRRSPWTS